MQNKQVRLANLRQLIKREGAVSQLALRLQISPIYIYRVLDGKFNIGDSMAIKIEDAYGYPPGWMDAFHNSDGEDEAHVPTLETVQRVPSSVDGLRPAAAPTAEFLPPATTPEPALNRPLAAASMPAPAPQRAPAPVASERGSDDEIRQRILSSIINTMDRLLVANNMDMSDLEKARMLMKAAETVLDGGGSARSSPAGSQKPALKIS
jgi:plasmid maintenance system antidote protein VapI